MAEGHTGNQEQEPLTRTPLHTLHIELGGKLVGFAGYEMPVQYKAGILKEHLHTRAAAGLFDVSHMGQVEIRGRDAAAALETLVPGDLRGLAVDTTRYTQFTNDQGGILDDLMVTRREDRLLLVVNAACKAADIRHLRAGLPAHCELTPVPDRALLALQGPAAAGVVSALGEPGLAAMPFMSFAVCRLAGVDCWIWRSGYTGEDGYEISCDAANAEGLARKLLEVEGVAPVGLGARDSLRLEAGLCLYGHDIDETTTPVEAGLLWSIGKRRRTAGGFPGAGVVQRQIAEGVKRRRVGLRPKGRAPVREQVKLLDMSGFQIGEVTSGGFGPSVGGPVAMGYVAAEFAKVGTPVKAEVRGNALEASIVRMPFVEQRYYRG
jgi:aminomethyltransferase